MLKRDGGSRNVLLSFEKDRGHFDKGGGHFEKDRGISQNVRFVETVGTLGRKRWIYRNVPI
jgi:hypothetical protein